MDYLMISIIEKLNAKLTKKLMEKNMTIEMQQKELVDARK
jgi:hypothetical protein